MTGRFFLDHCVPRSVGTALADDGHEVLLLREHLATDAPDDAVAAEARRLAAVVVTLDGDFADLVAFPPEHYAGIVALQVRNRPEALPRIIEQLRRLLHRTPNAEHLRGKLFLVEPHRVRVRG